MALNVLFGPAPVLSTENHEHYQEVMDQVMACLKPRDIIEQILVKNVVHASWLEARYIRHGTATIERWFHQSLEFQAQRTKQQNQRREAVAKELAAKENLKPADIAHLLELSDTVEESVGDVDRILERKPTELEHNRALEKGIGFQLQMDALRKSATVLRNESLMMLENYRTGLGYQVAEVADKIIDAEYAKLEARPEQIPAPPLAPSNEESNELGTQDASEPNQQPQK